MRNRKSFCLTVLVVIFVSFTYFEASAQSPQAKGMYTREYTGPVTAHIQNNSDAGRVRRIRGRFFNPFVQGMKEAPNGAIVSLFKLSGGKEKFIYSFLVGASGRFDFKGLKKGIYLLKTGTTTGGFNSEYVKVVLAPRDKRSSSKEIKIYWEIGT